MGLFPDSGAPETGASKATPKYRQRHEPVVIHTINPALSPISNRVLNRTGTMSPVVATTPSIPYSATYPPTPSTTTFSSTRRRADSAAARLAMESMIQERLDQLTRRLDRFNEQSFDLHARTQQLATEFQAKSRRLYRVEDHLLRIQGKPGLSDQYLIDGPQPRRLTGDLEELRMGVKTLRRKFHNPGSVIGTVNWLNHVKNNKNTALSSSSAAQSASSKPLTPMRALSKKKKEPLDIERIFTANTIPEVHLEQSPLESPFQQQQAAMSPSSSPCFVRDKEPEAAASILGYFSPPPTPKGLQSAFSPLMGQGMEKTNSKQPGVPVVINNKLELLAALTPAINPTLKEDDTSTSPSSSTSPPQPPFENTITATSTATLLPYSVPVAQNDQSDDIGEAKNAEEQSEAKEDDDIESRRVEIDEKEDSLNENGIHLQSTSRNDTDVPSPTTTVVHGEHEQVVDTWVQTVWRFLVRMEYFVLGTAILGAMVPDSIFALWGGFVSATIYAALVIYHRVAAPTDAEPPKPPTTGMQQRVERGAPPNNEADSGRLEQRG